MDPGRRAVVGRERSGSWGRSVMERGERVGHGWGLVRGHRPGLGRSYTRGTVVSGGGWRRGGGGGSCGRGRGGIFLKSMQKD